MSNVTIRFGSDAAAKHFALWLCGQGEQQYWDWMRYREQEEPGPITAVSFDYHNRNLALPDDNPNAYGEFLEDGIIRTELGRLTDTEER